MLKEYKSMTQEEMYTLVHEIYIEGCMENAREKYPDATDLTTAIQQEEDSFVCFLQDFFTLPENTYYVLEKDNMPVSAARLSKINDFYYLEALETPPQYRKKGYASELLNEMITHLHQQGSVDIRDCVSKQIPPPSQPTKNADSLLQRKTVSIILPIRLITKLTVCGILSDKAGKSA